MQLVHFSARDGRIEYVTEEDRRKLHERARELVRISEEARAKRQRLSDPETDDINPSNDSKAPMKNSEWQEKEVTKKSQKRIVDRKPFYFWCNNCWIGYPDIKTLQKHHEEEHDVDASGLNKWNYITWDSQIAKSLQPPTTNGRRRSIR